MLNLNAMFNISGVTPNTSEDIEVNSESLDADYRLNDLSSSINAISSQFSALMSSSNRISDMYSYIKLYGVDRACVQVYNRDGLLTDLSNGVVPATEDFRESNTRKYTIACMEGLGESITKVFKWCIEKLEAIGKWIADKVISAFKWLISKFSSNKKQIAEGIKQNEKLALMVNKIDGDESQITPEMKQKVAKVDKDCLEASEKILKCIKNKSESVDLAYCVIKDNFKGIEEAIQELKSSISLIGSDTKDDILPAKYPAVNALGEAVNDHRKAGDLVTFNKEDEKEELKLIGFITQVYATIYSGETEVTPEYGGVLKHCIKSHLKVTKKVYTALAEHESKIEQIIQECAGRADKLKKEVEQLHKDLAKALEKVDVNHESELQRGIGVNINFISSALRGIAEHIIDLGRYRLIAEVCENVFRSGKKLYNLLEALLKNHQSN